MKAQLAISAILGVLLAHVPAYALDDELKIGKEIFEQHCAACHGLEGNGDGQIAQLFKLKPKALSQLSKENGGEFPFDLVYTTLKATKPVQGHGQTAMPVWGGYFKVEEALENPDMDDEEALIAIGKLLSVVYYIETLQAR